MDRKEKDYNKDYNNELNIDSVGASADGENIFADTVADETAANEDITAEFDGFSDTADGETDDVDEITVLPAARAHFLGVDGKKIHRVLLTGRFRSASGRVWNRSAPETRVP